jgi:hypothetical protein
MAENENSLWDFTPKTNSRNDWFAELNRMQANFIGAPQPMQQQQQQQQMPNFGDGGVELQRLRNEGLRMGMQQLALRGAGNDINGWPLAAGPNPNDWTVAARARGEKLREEERAQWAEQKKAQRENIWAGLRGELPAQANPFLQRHLRPFIEQAADNSRKRQEANGWIFPNPKGAEQYGRQLKYGSPGMLPMDYRGPGIYYAEAGPDAPYEKWQPDNSFWGGMSRPTASGPYNPWNTPYNQDTLPAHLQLAGASAAGNPWAGVIAGMQGMFNPRMALPRAKYGLTTMENALDDGRAQAAQENTNTYF